MTSRERIPDPAVAGGPSDVSFLGRAVSRLIITENDLCPARQRRNAANGILNVSFVVLHGMTAETASLPAQRLGTIRATRTCVMQSLLRNGTCAQRRFKKTDSRGKYFGKRTIRCVSRASRLATISVFYGRKSTALFAQKLGPRIAFAKGDKSCR
jgi:hypothetical protein